MPREKPRFVKSFRLTGHSVATSYHFRPEGDLGWALATVNDATSELTICSDYGNWSHRWPGSDGMGRPSLTHFIAEFAGKEECHYLADKLTSWNDRNEFSPKRTVTEIRRLLCANRLEQGRNLIGWYEGGEPEDIPCVGTDDPPRHSGMEWREVKPKYSSYRTEHWPLTKQTARRLWDELGDIDHVDDAHDFVARFYDIEGHEWIGANIEFEHLRYEPSCMYHWLLWGILPALAIACERTIAARETGAPVMNPWPAVVQP